MTLKDYLLTIQQATADALALLPVTQPQTPVITTSQGLTDALAVGGGPYTLAPGDYVGNFIAGLPVTISEAQRDTVRLLAGDPFLPTLRVRGNAVHWTGCTLPNGRDDREVVEVGDPNATDPSTQPDDVVFAGMKLIAGATGGKRGFALHGRKVSLLGCEALNFWRKGQDSQAVWVHNGPGPYLIDGGIYEASGENILSGGGLIKTQVNPTGTVKNAILRKPLAWKGQGYLVKNLLELKAGEDWLIEKNTFDGCWSGEGQAGFAVQLTPETQGVLQPWLAVDLMKIYDNMFRNCERGFNVLGADQDSPTLPMTSLSIAGNYLPDAHLFLQVLQAPKLVLDVYGNTAPATWHSFLQMHGPAISALTFKRNVVSSGLYGIAGDDGATAGLAALTAAVQNGDVSGFTGNVIEQSARFPLKFPNPTSNRIVPPGQLAALLGPDGKMLDGSAGY